MTIEKRIEVFTQLGRFLNLFAKARNGIPDVAPEEEKLHRSLWEKIENAKHHNGWFTEENVLFSFQQWANVLSKENLTRWVSQYDIPSSQNPKTVAIIMAGNIPLVGFHDFLSVLISGNKVLVKQSSNDNLFLPILVDFLILKAAGFEELIEFTDGKLENFDAVIATGSNNTARYFEYYFSQKPHIIRKNRVSTAVLNGSETEEELKLLGKDIFRYFGLGCRNVSKLYVPENYDFDQFFKSIFDWKDLINHSKYANNYDYNKAVYLMSDFKILDNGFVLLKEDESLHSPIGVIFYEYYSDKDKLKSQIEARSDQLQCVVSKGFVENSIPFGKTQQPKLWDYADGVDVMEFLIKS